MGKASGVVFALPGIRVPRHRWHAGLLASVGSGHGPRECPESSCSVPFLQGWEAEGCIHTGKKAKQQQKKKREYIQ